MPLTVLLSYGIAKLGSTFFIELRTWLFANCVWHGCRVQANQVFRHLHALDIDYLLSLKGGEIQQIINRSLQSIMIVSNTVLWNVAPT